MKYILIKKKYGNDNANLSDILREYLESNYNIEPGENTIIIDDCKVQYSLAITKMITDVFLPYHQMNVFTVMLNA